MSERLIRVLERGVPEPLRGDPDTRRRGLHEVRVALHAEVSAMIKVNVARSPEEAELQAQGVDVMAQLYQRDDAGFTEAYDPNAEPGEIATEAAAAPGEVFEAGAAPDAPASETE